GRIFGDLFGASLAAFAEKLEVHPPEHIPDLEDSHFSRPLYIQMAALMALRGERPKSAEALPRALVNHERRYWAKMLGATADQGEEVVHRASVLMTLSTLANGIATERMLEDILDVSDVERTELKSLYRMLTPLYPDHHQGLQGLRPDLIGEALVAQSLLGARGVELLDQVLASGSHALRRSSLTVVARLLREREDLLPVIEEVLRRHFVSCVDDCIAVCLETSGPLLEVVERAYQGLPPRLQSQASGALMQWLNYDIVPLAKLSISVRQSQVLRCLQKMSKKETSRSIEDYAAALGHLTFALKNDGQTREALAVVEQALALGPKLRGSRDNDLRQNWHLRLHSELLTVQGQNDEALASAQKALRLSRQIISAHGNKDSIELSKTLGICASCLADCGKSEEALHLSEEGLQLTRSVGRAVSKSNQNDLAVSLSIYARCLGMNGHIHKALAANKEGLGLRRALMESEPEKHRQNFALTLMTYAARLSDVGEIEEALRLTKESLSINRALAESKPERFGKVLADTLSNCMVIEAEAGNFDASVTLSEELLALYELLVQSNPERFRYSFEEGRLGGAYVRWLRDGGSMEEEARRPVAVGGNVQKQRSLDYEQHWLLAFSESTLQAVKRAKECWEKLDFSQQFSMRNKYVLLNAFSDHRFGLSDEHWRAQLVELRETRKGHIPAWMSETARLLAFPLL
ncbi:tetratricopeptide repeat protein, partial [Pseudomonas rubra]